MSFEIKDEYSKYLKLYIKFYNTFIEGSDNKTAKEKIKSEIEEGIKNREFNLIRRFISSVELAYRKTYNEKLEFVDVVFYKSDLEKYKAYKQFVEEFVFEAVEVLEVFYERRQLPHLDLTRFLMVDDNEELNEELSKVIYDKVQYLIQQNKGYHEISIVENNMTYTLIFVTRN